MRIKRTLKVLSAKINIKIASMVPVQITCLCIIAYTCTYKGSKGEPNLSQTTLDLSFRLYKVSMSIMTKEVYLTTIINNLKEHEL